jgi:hypothetical protein
VAYDLGTLTRDAVHTIKFWMKLNPGPDADVVRIYIDGEDVGRSFTTWENYCRAASQPVPTSDSLEFRDSGDGVTILNLVGGGYLFDNVSITTANGPGPPGCDVPIDEQADSPTVSAGGIAGLPDHRPQPWPSRRPRPPGLRSHPAPDDVRERRPEAASPRPPPLPSDPAPRPGQRDSFHLMLRVNANAQPGSLANVSDAPVEPPGLPRRPWRPRNVSAGRAGPSVAGHGDQGRRVKKVKAIVSARG